MQQPRNEDVTYALVRSSLLIHKPMNLRDQQATRHNASRWLTGLHANAQTLRMIPRTEHRPRLCGRRALPIAASTSFSPGRVSGIRRPAG